MKTIWTILGVILLAANQPLQAQFSFGTESTNGSGSPSISYNSSNNGSFQYTDTASSANDSASIPLIEDTSVITSATSWTATVEVNLTPTSMTSTGTGAASPVVAMGLSLGTGNNSLSVQLSQFNNTGGTGNPFVTNDSYGTAVSFRAEISNVNQATTPLGGSATYNDISYQQLSGGNSGSASTKSIGAATAYVTLSYNASTNIVTGYYNGAPIGSYSLAGWGTNPTFNLSVFGFSSNFNVASGAATATNFNANSGSPADIGNYGIYKEITYDQSSSSLPVLDPNQPFQFYCFINPGTSGALLTNASISGAGTVSFTSSPYGLNSNEYFTSESAFNAAFPSGNTAYNLTVQTSSPNTYNEQLTFGTDSYPAVPQITSVTYGPSNTPATWSNGNIVVPDNTQAITINFTNSSGAYVNANINNTNSGLPNSSGEGLTSITIPANFLSNNSAYQSNITLTNGAVNSTNTNTIPGNGGNAYFETQVNFTIQTGTISASNSPTFNTIFKEHVQVQTSASGPVDASGDSNNFDAAPYQFTIQYSASGTVSGPSSTSFPLAYDAGGGNNGSGDYEFSSGPVASSTLLDSTYPSGTYTFPGTPTESFSLTGDAYPTAPTITAVNGGAPVWDAQGQLVLDPTINNTITWTWVSVPSNFSTNYHESFNFSSDNSNFNGVDEEAGALTTNGAFTSNALQDIPAGSMTAGATYHGSISYIYAPTAPTNPSTNVYDVAGYETETEFRAIATFPTGLPQVINFPTIPDQAAGATINLSTLASASSNLTVTYNVSGVSYTTSGSSVTFTGTGTATITATQTGNSVYGPAPTVTQTFLVGGQGSQTINFPAPTYNQTIGNSIALDATASSGLPVTYSLTTGSGIAVISGSASTGYTLTFTGAGQVTVEADQAGSATYSPALAVSQSFDVSAPNDVGFFQIAKNVVYDQTSTSTPTLDPEHPYQFYSSINAGAVGTILSNSTLSPPVPSTGTVAYQSNGANGMSFEESFTTYSALNAAFDAGTYNLTIQTSTPNTYSTQLTFGSDNYPAVPQITSVTYGPSNTPLTWSNGVLDIPDTVVQQNLNITFNWTNPNDNGAYFEIDGVNNGAYISSGGNQSTSYTISASQLQQDSLYTAFVDNNNISGSAGSAGSANGNALFKTEVDFAIQVGTPTTSGKSFYLVSKDHVSVQSSNSAPSDGVGDVQNFSPAPYNFSIKSPVTGTVTGPSSSSFPLTYDANGGNNPYKYSSGAVASVGTLNSNYLDGSYTFPGLSAVSLSGDFYPNTPQVTAVNGQTPVWYNGQLVLDPTIDNTITWTAFSVGSDNTTFAASGNESFEFSSPNNGDVIPKQKAGLTTSTTTAFNTSQVIPAGTLTANETYIGDITYFLASAFNTVNSSTYSGAGYQTETYFTAIAEPPYGFSQTINFSTIANQTYAPSLSVPLNASSESGQTVSFSILSGSSIASINGTTLNITGAGTVTVQATAPATALYAAATSTQTITVAPATPTITFSSTNNQQYDGTTVTATASSGGAITYTGLSGAIQLTNGVPTFTGTGSASITANVAATANYAAASLTENYNVSAATDVSGYNIQKAVNYDQTGASTVVIDPRTPYQVYTQVNPGNLGIVLSSTSLIPPVPSTGTVAFQASSNGLQFGQSFTSQSALDAAFDSGTYNFTIQTSTPNTYNETLTVGADNFPGIPQITAVTNATWSNGVLLVTNSASPVTISCSNPDNDYNNDLYLNINGNGGSSPTVVTNYSNNVTTFTITGLQSNTLYQENITLSNNTSESTTIPGASANVYFQTHLNFTLQNGTPAASSKSYYLVAKENVLLQTSASAPVNAGAYDNFDFGPYNLEIQCPVSGTVTGPSSTSFPLSVDSGDSGFQYKYYGLPYSTQASLDSAAPNGTYTLPGGATVSLTGVTDAFPTAPQITLVNGNPAVWDAQGQLVLDPTIANTITWSSVSINNFSTLGHESFSFEQSNGGNFTSINLSSGYSSSSTTPFTSNATQVIAANTMTAGSTYQGTIQYLQGTTATSPSSNVYDVAGFQTETEFTAVALKPQTVTLPTIAAQQYGGGTYQLNATASSSLPVTYSVTGPATLSNGVLTFTGAGQVTVTAMQAGNGTYASTAVSQTFTVNKAPLNVAVVSGGHSTYGSTPVNPGITLVSGTLYSGDTLSSIGLADNFALTSASGAGAYTISVTGASAAANYVITTQSATFTVNKAPLTVAVVSGGQSTYGSTPVNPGITLVSGTLYNGDSLSSIGLGDSFALTSFSAANTYTINVTGASSAANYTVTAQSASFTINPAPLTITANNANKTYGQTLTLNGSAFGSTGLQNSETIGSVTLTSTGAAGSAMVTGSPYSIVPSSPTGGTFNPANYSITYDNGQLTVAKAAITVAVNSGGNSTYGTTPVDPGITLTAGTLYNGDTLSSIGLGDSFSSLDLNSASSAGTFTVNVTGGGSVANYNVTTQSATYTINQASQTISFTMANQQYPGGATLTATASSGLPVSFVYGSGPYSLSGTNNSTLTTTGVTSGTPATIEATQAGNNNYLPASTVTQNFSITASPNETFAQWEALYPGLTDLAPKDTPEHDGVPTLLKYVFDIDPSHPMTAAERLRLPDVVNTATTQTISFPEYSLKTGITITVQTSPDMVNWSPVVNGTNGAVISQNGMDGTDPVYQFQTTFTAPRQFIRVNVTMP